MEDPAAQQRALAEANKRVMQEAFLMKRATVRLQRSPLAPLETSAADREKRGLDKVGLFSLCWQPPAAATEQQIFLVSVSAVWPWHHIFPCADTYIRFAESFSSVGRDSSTSDCEHAFRTGTAGKQLCAVCRVYPEGSPQALRLAFCCAWARVPWGLP